MPDSSQKDDKKQNERISGQVLSRFREDEVEVVGLLNPRESKQESIGEAIGKRISTLRQKKDMTQAELAEKIGKKHAWLSKVERGNTRFFVADLIGLADALESPLHRLIPSEDDAESIAASLAADLKGQGGSGHLFMFRLGGPALDIAVAGNGKNSGGLRDWLRKKIARMSARSIGKVLLQYFDLEHERIQQLKEKHEYVKDSIEDGSANISLEVNDEDGPDR